MRRYYLKIKNTVIPCVTDIGIVKSWRNEIKQTNLEGDSIIDRGNKKYSLSVKIGLISSAVLKDIENAVDDIFFPVQFYEENNLINKTFSVDSFDKPAPVYLNNNRSDGVYYENIFLNMEER